MVATSAASLPRDPVADSCVGCVINATPTGTAYGGVTLSARTTYYWQVKARPPASDTQHNFGDWSAVASFTTQAPKPTVTLSADPQSITASDTATLSWSSTEATSCTASGGWSGEKATSGLQTVTPEETTTYTLTCTGDGGDESKSTTVAVTEPPANLPPAILLTPKNGATDVTTTPTFTWTAVEGSSSYRIMIATDPASLPPDPAADSCVDCINATSVEASYTGAHLTAGETYFWQVKARPPLSDAEHDFGEWSDVSSFTTGASIPHCRSLFPNEWKLWNAPFGLKVADLDDDGMDDVVAVDGRNVDGHVHVALGRGNGTFGAVDTFDVGSAPGDVAVGDMNGDGIQDLVVANSGMRGFPAAVDDSTVSVLLGVGNGEFEAHVTFEVGHSPTSIALGDIDSDGKLDIASVGGGTSSISIGNGDGTLQPASAMEFDEPLRDVALVDVNDDAALDLLFSRADGHLSVLLGTGRGTFGAPQAYEYEVSGPGGRVGTDELATGDIDGDSRVDVIVAGGGVLRGVGGGRFEVVPSSNPGAYRVALGDVDNDGKLDLVTSTSGAYPVKVLLGAGDGTFGELGQFLVGRNPGSVALGDLNRDGNVDMMTANEDGTLSVLIGLGDGIFSEPPAYPVTQGAHVAALADFNKDGRADVAVAYDSAVGVLLGTADGAFGPERTFSGGSDIASIRAGDVDGDGYDDLLTLTGDWVGSGPGTISGSVNVFMSNRDGTFQAAGSFPAGTESRSMRLADLNGDENLDVAATSTFDDTIRILLGNGDGTFQTGDTIAFADGMASDLVLADVNGDDVQDIVTDGQGSESVIRSLLGRGDGTFEDPLSFPISSYANSVRVTDVTGDGNDDVVVASAQSDEELLVLVGAGDGTFGSERTQSIGFFTSLDLGPIDSDDILDLVVSRGRTVGVFLGNGDGTFGEAHDYAVFDSSDVALGDINRDGRLDVVAAGGGGLNATVTVLLQCSASEGAKGVRH